MVTFLSLVSGSSGNASLVSDGVTTLLIDCGVSGKKLEQSLHSIDRSASSIDALLITHEHSDHICGAGVISRRYDLPLYATEKTHAAMNIGKIKPENRKMISAGTTFEIGTIGVHPFSIPHDAADPVGYNFFAEHKKYTLATDLGHMNDELKQHLLGSHSIVLESNHDVEMLRVGSYPYPLKQRVLGNKGHLSNENAASTVIDLVHSGTEHIMLGHLSIENNTPEIAHLTTASALSSVGILPGSDVTLSVAHRFEVTGF